MSCLENEYFPLKANSIKTVVSLEVKCEEHMWKCGKQLHLLINTMYMGNEMLFYKKKNEKNVFGMICMERSKAVQQFYWCQHIYSLGSWEAMPFCISHYQRCTFMYNYWWALTKQYVFLYLVIYILFTFRFVCKWFILNDIKMLCHCYA